jgi:hypothetical protein
MHVWNPQCVLLIALGVNSFLHARFITVSYF